MIKQAVNIIKDGGVLVYPTDTVWGLGCDALNKKAVSNLIKAKKKPEDAKLIWLFPSIKMVKIHFPKLTKEEESLLNKKRTTVIINNQAIRVVKNGWLNKFLSACQTPLTSTSANIHGKPVIKKWTQALKEFNNINAVIKGRHIINPKPSTIVKVENQQIKILRKGGGISIK